MVGSRDEIAFEVHVLRWDRWELHGRYPAGQKDVAVKDGRSLEKVSSISAVRVIRAFDPAEGLHQETTLYESPSLSGKGLRKGGRRPKGAADGNSATEAKPSRGQRGASKSAEARPAQAKPRQRSPGLALFVKLTLVTLFSMVFGGLAMGLASVWLDEASLGRDVHSNILFGIFIGTFLVSAIIMALTFLSDEDLGSWSWRPSGEDSRAKPKKRAAVKARQAPDAAPVPEETAAMAEAVAAQLAETLHGEAPETAAPAESAESEEPAETAEVAAAGEPAEPVETAEVAEADASDKADTPVPAEEPQEEADSADDNAPAYSKEQKAYMTAFLDGALGDVDRERLGSFERFGVDLFLAGACEALAQDGGMEAPAMSDMLRDIIRSLGFNESQAETFAERYQDYLVDDPRYLHMFTAGRNALNARLGGDPNTAKYLEQALAQWNTPKAKEPAIGLISVMFTDIAGSTGLTQDKGDDAAQEVVHAHNRIVREALLQFNGKEIKHTGDGIMASFSITSNSIEAASVIQRRAAAHNLANPDQPLGLKIGINAGEPISEDDDLFGTTVQIAARIVNQAGPGQILVSEIVRGICAGKKLVFVSRGPHVLKGFRGELTLYEVVWRTSPVAAPGPREAHENAAIGTNDETTAEPPAEPAHESAPETAAEAAPETGSTVPPPETASATGPADAAAPEKKMAEAEPPGPDSGSREPTTAAKKPQPTAEPAPASAAQAAPAAPPPQPAAEAPADAEPATLEIVDRGDDGEDMTPPPAPPPPDAPVADPVKPKADAKDGAA